MTESRDIISLTLHSQSSGLPLSSVVLSLCPSLGPDLRLGTISLTFLRALNLSPTLV